MLVSDIQRKVYRLFGDSESEQLVILPADIYDWINEAQLQIVRNTGCLTATATANASTYPAALPSDWLTTKRVVYGTHVLKLVNIEDLDQIDIDPSYQDSPDFYFIWNGQLNLFPNPQDTDTTQVSHYYTKIPANVSAGGNTPSVPVSYHEDLVRFCLMRAHERNENWKAVEVSSGFFQSNEGLRMEESKVSDDDFLIIRDDPGELDIYGSLW